MTSAKHLEVASEAELHEWITTLGLSLDPEDSLQEQLRDGILLCQLVNRIKPGSVDNVSSSSRSLYLFIEASRTHLICANVLGWKGGRGIRVYSGVYLITICRRLCRSNQTARIPRLRKTSLGSCKLARLSE